VTDGEHVAKIHLWEEMGPVAVRTIMESVNEISYRFYLWGDTNTYDP
jgi:hypothetical protein